MEWLSFTPEVSLLISPSTTLKPTISLPLRTALSTIAPPTSLRDAQITTVVKKDQFTASDTTPSSTLLNVRFSLLLLTIGLLESRMRNRARQNWFAIRLQVCNRRSTISAGIPTLPRCLPLWPMMVASKSGISRNTLGPQVDYWDKPSERQILIKPKTVVKFSKNSLCFLLVLSTKEFVNLTYGLEHVPSRTRIRCTKLCFP